MNNDNIVLTTDLPLPLFIRGKVRDTYDLGEHLLIVTTDRISAFDVILPCGIPDKGRILNQMSVFWMEKTSRIIPNHLIASVDEVGMLDEYIPADKRFEYPKYLKGRSVIVKKAERIEAECVVRGYLAGSGWSEYQEKGSICGVKIIPGLLESQQLPQSVFTPTTKADEGHDMPMDFEMLERAVGNKTASSLQQKSIELYNHALKYASGRGFIIADTKFEFGIHDGRLIIIDEMLTPDSSRFWDKLTYKAGQPQDSFDKQPIRDWLSRSGWNKTPPGPVLPEEVITNAANRYRQAYERITGRTFS
ncbi:MAG: phosphoribosylaminoimidazolesuccinocarboxamide synthase [Dehalococcoidales bacterium]|nr:phosphoribosylaminoimidazolesuccinocarboxamide synthase [Dehalococcoidales bacterium]MDD5122477.1 phosphoribosylaminoimidazolesuccinocarboxamide synthase [Dehalococcoidales bacterium]